MKKVNAYKAEDGTLFTSKKDALEHDKVDRVSAGLRSLCEEHLSPYDNRPEEVAKTIFENKASFVEALNGWYIVPGHPCKLCGGDSHTGHQRLCEVYDYGDEDDK